MRTPFQSRLKYFFLLILLPLLIILSGCGKDEDTINNFTDQRDGQVYQTIQIGTQIWMAENLNYDLPGGVTKCYDDAPNNCDIYGRLYDWQTAMNIAPDGWHLPSSDEWDILVDFLGGTSVAGGKLKEAGFDHWSSPNGGATNETGFTALPAGQLRETDGASEGLGAAAYFWSSTSHSGTAAWSYKAISLFPTFK